MSLFEERPLVISPALAVKVGVNEAIFLQQLHYWLKMPQIGQIDKDGVKWVRNTLDQWIDGNFPFWSKRTLRRIISNLIEAGVVLKTSTLNKVGYDKTLWYTIDHEALNRLAEDKQKKPEVKPVVEDEKKPVEKVIKPETPDKQGWSDEWLKNENNQATEDKKTPTSKKKPHTQADKDNLLIFGTFDPEDQSLITQKTRDAMTEILNAGWDIGHNPNLLVGVAFFTNSMRLYVSKGYVIPNGGGQRKYWEKAILAHLSEFSLAELRKLYPKAVSKLVDAKLSVASPESLTKTMFAIRYDDDSKQNYVQTNVQVG